MVWKTLGEVYGLREVLDTGREGKANHREHRAKERTQLG
jgi:hypothetical protein